MSLEPNFTTDGGDWVCARCNVPLEQIKVQALYMHSAFDVFLPRCPSLPFTRSMLRFLPLSLPTFSVLAARYSIFAFTPCSSGV